MSPVPDEDDVAQERERLLDRWDEAAAGWGRQADRLQAAARPISEWMISHAQPGPGDRVLELAAGPGDTGFMAARLVEPGGTVICSDAVTGMLDVARVRAAEQGVSNVEFRQLQLEWIDLPTASVDVVLCRWGIMLIIDPPSALRECRRVLKPGGRIAVAVWDAPEANPWRSTIDRVLTELGYAEPPPAAGVGMFSLAAPGRLQQLLEDAGFLEIEVEPVPIVRRYDSVLDWVGESRDLSRPFSEVWRGLPDPQRRELREAVARAGAAYVEATGAVRLPGSSLAAAALA